VTRPTIDRSEAAPPASERVPTDPRLRRRRRAVRRTRRRRNIGRAAGAAGAALALWFAFWSPLLEVRAVDVVGGRHTGAAEAAAAGDLLGRNLLLLSTSDAADAIAALPWVRRARVERILPATVRVRITERRPALAARVGQAWWTVDARGRVLDAGRAVRSLPALVGLSGERPEVGDTLADPTGRSALRVLRALGEDLRRRLDAVVARSPEGITLSLRDGPLVRWGAAERLAAKRAVLRALLHRLRRDGRAVGYVDVRVPESPAVGGALRSP
jgi:cell division protein FtsQ